MGKEDAGSGVQSMRGPAAGVFFGAWARVAAQCSKRGGDAGKQCRRRDATSIVSWGVWDAREKLIRLVH